MADGSPKLFWILGFCFFRRCCFCVDFFFSFSPVTVVARKDEVVIAVAFVVVYKLAGVRLEEKEGTKPFVVQLPKKKRRIQTVRVLVLVLLLLKLELALQLLRDVMTD
jgi:hypothetical protein